MSDEYFKEIIIMKVIYFSAQEFSPEEIEQLEKLPRTIEAAISDGKLSHDKLENIKNTAFTNKKLFLAELQLYRTMVLDKIEAIG
jgi:hypothetical protein